MNIDAKYDLIIAGAGLSGLSLAWYLAKGGYKGEVLIVDSTFAPVNDKTWCFWSNGEAPFEQIIFQSWSNSFISALDYSNVEELVSYSYHCIRSGDFREFVLKSLKSFRNFTLLEEDILDFSSNSKKAALITKSGDTYLANQIYQSVKKPKELKKKKISDALIQHFLGYEIRTKEEIFDPHTFTLMDFDEAFGDKGVAFMYVLPFETNRALLEYTIFSASPLDKDDYRDKINDYLKRRYNIGPDQFEISREEYGEIPMEIRPYIPYYEQNVINMGTVGGLTKPSTGYTFIRIQEYTRKEAARIIAGESPKPPERNNKRFEFYDSLLLNILANHSEIGVKIFRDLFDRNNVDEVFKFLGEETSLLQDLKIMSSVPYIPFIKAIFNR
ncbi:lycopene cyclase family protein [Balneola sp. MJW-20]|uniref:lycopene cyclase family protein n=1 Tax=Gracilimonas aurantiaca TaxID=3234185 RepID=UPI003466CD50